MCEPSKEIIIQHLYGAQTEACKVKIEKNSKGVNWELSISGPDFASCIRAIEEANEVMKAKFGGA